MALIDHINQVDATIRELEHALRDMHKYRDEPNQERESCEHEFSEPLKNYEHEGGTCTNACQRIGKNYKR